MADFQKTYVLTQAHTQEFFSGGGAKPSKQQILSNTFLFSNEINAKSTYIGKYRLTLIYSIVSDGGRRLKPQKYVLGSCYVHSDIEL